MLPAELPIFRFIRYTHFAESAFGIRGSSAFIRKS